MSYPTVVAFDTDMTLWIGLLNFITWGRGWGASMIQEDNIERIDRYQLRDRSNLMNVIELAVDVPNIISDVLQNNAKLAIVSRNLSKAMCDRALYYFSTIKPDGSEASIIHMVNYDEVVNESKANHFRRIASWSGADYSEMLMFDDEGMNNVVRIELGTTFQIVNGGMGLNWGIYQLGLAAWRRARSLMIPSNPSGILNRQLIGYSGLPNSWIDLVRKGEGIVETEIPYRWGFGLYVTSSMDIAKYFSGLNGSWDPAEQSHVCEVWVKDYDAWLNVQKIWIAENGILQQMNNQMISPEEAGQNQENRDNFIAGTWGVWTPYVTFCQHFWMNDMPGIPFQRWSEMVIPTQVYRALIDLNVLSDALANRNFGLDAGPFPLQIKTWGIQPTDEARAEFLRYGESEMLLLSL
ncbi:acid phosphatase-domain-containing protein [Crepidotus variabilis]|uniref:Acid phosphatase-domain-containing protein n=1 Tax=Crepidotus variabilis TaxID=179855 RepID=A0A9P6EIV4_9AGAR|nr:acid phosphatase-domain-containing protein [Crepidotus variabilis]